MFSLLIFMCRSGQPSTGNRRLWLDGIPVQRWNMHWSKFAVWSSLSLPRWIRWRWMWWVTFYLVSCHVMPHHVLMSFFHDVLCHMVLSVCWFYSYFWVHHLIFLNQEPKPSGCDEKEFQCEDGACIDHELICNNAYDCHDGSDESECSEFQISWSLYSLFVFHHIIKTVNVKVCWRKQTFKQ